MKTLRSRARCRRPARALVVVLALVAAPASSADPADPKPSAAADAIGRAHFQRGQSFSAKGEYAAAYREFEAGYAASGRPLFLFNMAEAARAGGDVEKARESYLKFLRIEPRSALAATARTRLADLDREAGITSPPPDVPAARTESAVVPPVTAGSEAPRTEPLPLLPPATSPPPPGASSQSLPPERFTGPTATEEDRPLWKRWPLWAVVGGVVAGGVVVFAVTRDRPDSCGTGCSELNFR